MNDALGLDGRYVRTMKHVWDSAHNDQRPAILEWIARCRPAGKLLDIGPGDAYYMATVQPSSCVLVEPNVVLRGIAKSHCASLCIDVRVYSSVAQYLQEALPRPSCDLVLMIHVLFYMTHEEIEQLLLAIGGRRLAMVHPTLEDSVTVEFEESIGLNDCRNRVAQKHRLLGMPTTRASSRSHFRMPLSATDEDLAFLVAHPTLHGPHWQKRLDAALMFVRERRPRWVRSDYLELPQAQVLETYKF